MIRMVVFDMAGTTVNEDNVVYKTLQQAINKKGFAVTLTEVLTLGAGKEKMEAVTSILQRCAGDIDRELANEIFEDFLSMLQHAYQKQEISPQENALELLQQLTAQNIVVVLNTGYDRNTAELLLRKLNWNAGEHYDALVTATDVARSRPHPEMILLAMEQFGISDPGEVVKVGDSIIDIEEGKNAGCRLTIGVTTGAHTREQLASAKPSVVIDNLNELIPLLATAAWQS